MQNLSIALSFAFLLVISGTFCNPVSTSLEYDALEGQIVKENSSLLGFEDTFNTYDTEDQEISYEYSEEIPSTLLPQHDLHDLEIQLPILEKENSIVYEIPQNESQAEDLIPIPSTQTPPEIFVKSTKALEVDNSASTSIEESYDSDERLWGTDSQSRENERSSNSFPTENILHVPAQQTSTPSVVLEQQTPVIVDSSLEEETEISEYVDPNSREQQRNVTANLTDAEELEHRDYTEKEPESPKQTVDYTDSDYSSSSEEFTDVKEEPIEIEESSEENLDQENRSSHNHGQILSSTPGIIEDEDPIPTNNPITVDNSLLPEENPSGRPPLQSKPVITSGSLSATIPVAHLVILTSMSVLVTSLRAS